MLELRESIGRFDDFFGFSVVLLTLNASGFTSVVIGSVVSEGLGALGAESVNVSLSSSERSVLNPVVDIGGEEPLENNHTGTRKEVKEKEENVGSLPKSTGVSSGHDESEVTHPVTTHDSNVGHGDGGGEHLTRLSRVLSHNNDPGNSSGHPASSEHVDHILVELTFSDLEPRRPRCDSSKQQIKGDRNEDE